MAKQPAKKAVTPSFTPVNLIPEALARKLFMGIAVVLVAGMAFLSKDYGITGDENFHRVYGHHVWHFYTSLGADKTATLPYGNPDSLMMYYGGFYDGSAAALSEALPSVNEWKLRHFWNSLFGSAAMILAGLVAVELAGWQAGLLVLLFMAFSPRFFGESMNNPKDITMTTGYLLSYVFILRFMKQLPRPSLAVSLGLGAAIGVALGIRIGGLLLIPYLFLFYGLAMWQQHGLQKLFNFSEFKTTVWPSFRFALLASVVGYALGMLFWPYGLISPITHTLETLGVSQKFPAMISMLFEGKRIASVEIPWYYIPKWLWITTPLFGLAGLLASPIIIRYYQQQGKGLLLAFVYFTLAFPVFYIIYKKAVLYDGMRHMYFVYPSIIILSGLTFDYLLKRFGKPVQWGIAALIVVLMALPARFMVANHPNQAVYFNELIGGIKGAYGNYETDYYMNSVRQCTNWLKQNENLKRTDGRKNIIYSNAVSPATHDFSDDTAHVAVGYISYRNRATVDADYLIFYPRYIDRELYISGAFPPEQTIYTVTVDGIPIACVVRKDDKSDFLAMEAIKQNDFERAIQLLEPYSAKYPKADVALMNLGLAYLQTARTDPERVQQAITVLNNCLALNKENPNAIYYLSVAYEMTGNTQQAQYLRSLIQQ